jgi:hypothetical protein
VSDTVLNIFNQQGGLIDAEAVTTTVGSAAVLRQRVQISVRDATTGTPTDIGDAVNQAIRVNLVAGNLSSNPNVTVTNWTYANAITVTGQLTTTPPALTTVTGLWPATLSSQWPTTMTFLPVTMSNPAVTILGTPAVTFSQGTQQVTFTAGTWPVTQSGNTWLVSATQGSNPWVVSPSIAWPVSLTTALPWPVSVTGTPLAVTQSFGTLSVTYTAPQFAPVPATLTSQWPTTVTFYPVTFSNPAVTILGQPINVTQSFGTLIVSPSIAWPVSFTGFQPVTFSGAQPVTVTTVVVTPSQAFPVSLTTALPWPVTQSGNTWLVSATQGSNPWVVTLTNLPPATTATVKVGASGAALAMTLSNVANAYQYITGWEIDAYATGAVTTATQMVVVTVTGLPGTPMLAFPTMPLVTGSVVTKANPPMFSPLRATAQNTSMTFAAPAVAGLAWVMNVFYYVAP